MANFCLIKPLADKFKQALRDGTINPEKLADVSSQERREFFANIVGEENAQRVNTLFEKNLLAKNRQAAMISWAKQVTGITEKQRNSLVNRIQKMDDRILNPKEEKAFLEDLAEQRIGTKVTLEEAKQITQLSEDFAKEKENLLPVVQRINDLETKKRLGSITSEEKTELNGLYSKYNADRFKFGAAREQMENLLNDIKRDADKISLTDLKKAPVRTLFRGVSYVSGMAKSLKASLDASFLFRQGFKAMFTNPKQFAQSAAFAFKNIAQTAFRSTKDERIMQALKSDVYSRRNSLNGNYERMKLAIGTGEEAFPTQAPEMIPGVGRVFKASSVGYETFLLRLRADIADTLIQKAEDAGVNLRDADQAQALGRLINSLTGRGDLGSFEGVGKSLNNVFFAPKNFVANVDFLTAHVFRKGGILSGDYKKGDAFTQRQNAINLVKVISGTAALLAIAKALWPDSVEEDPRSADFGKIRIGDTRFDVSGGLSSIVTLASRIVSRSSKSSVSGRISKLGNEFGEKSPIEVTQEFFGNKLSPAASAVAQLYNGFSREGKELVPSEMLLDLFAPLPTTNIWETYKNPNSAPLLAVLISDSLGAATNTYSDESALGEALNGNRPVLKEIYELSNKTDKQLSFTNWDGKAKNLTQFKETVGKDKFDEARIEYDKRVKEGVESLLETPKYQNASDEEKMSLVNAVDTQALNGVFSLYRFKYKEPKK